MNSEMYTLLRTPPTENFASGARDFMLHKGSSTSKVVHTIAAERLAKKGGKPSGESRSDRQSPMIMRKEMVPIAALPRHAAKGKNLEFGPTVAAQASAKLDVPVFPHKSPMRTKVYALNRESPSATAKAGIKAWEFPPKAATPFGSDNIPAPTMFFAMLTVDWETELSCGEGSATDVGRKRPSAPSARGVRNGPRPGPGDARRPARKLLTRPNDRDEAKPAEPAGGVGLGGPEAERKLKAVP
mmetsp:Transcript_75555/g.218262  ORF Transcript_75555/g.218262 Transcript_75555/m.218262 type:complete len:242 (-) Transcript_75555:88-813(-)